MHKIAAIWTSHTNSSMGPVGPATMTHGVDSGGGGGVGAGGCDRGGAINSNTDGRKTCNSLAGQCTV